MSSSSGMFAALFGRPVEQCGVGAKGLHGAMGRGAYCVGGSMEDLGGLVGREVEQEPQDDGCALIGRKPVQSPQHCLIDGVVGRWGERCGWEAAKRPSLDDPPPDMGGAQVHADAKQPRARRRRPSTCRPDSAETENGFLRELFCKATVPEMRVKCADKAAVMKRTHLPQFVGDTLVAAHYTHRRLSGASRDARPRFSASTGGYFRQTDQRISKDLRGWSVSRCSPGFSPVTVATVDL